MWLTTEDLGDIQDVTPGDIDTILPEDAFGKFAILSACEGRFIQAGNDWQPVAQCRNFLQQHGSDPWLLEYRDGKSGGQFRAVGHVTLEQVRQAFKSYLAGGQDWRRDFVWEELEL